MDTDKMTKGQEKRHVPRLRFPEFQGDLGWRETYFKSLCSNISSGKDRNNPEGMFNLYGSTGVIGKTAHASYEGCYLLVARVGANAGLLTIASGSFGVTDNTLVVDLKNQKKLDFVYYLLDQIGLNKLVFGSGQPLITGKLLKNLKIFLPGQTEQQKIADCLSSVDALIGLQGRKVEQLARHKQALLQQLFPNDELSMMNDERTENSSFITHHSQFTPRLRFPECRTAPAWEEKRLGDVAERLTEKVGSSKLTTVSITAGVGFVSQAEKFSRDISGKQYQNYIVLRRGEFSYNKGNSKKFPQGCIYELKEFEKVAAPNAFISFRFKEEYVPSFYQGYFDRNFHGVQLARFITSGARSDGLLNIGIKDFFSIVLPTPVDIEEQQKIANCLSSLDTLIDLHRRKLEALKRHKQGLMQQLFPAEEEA